MEGKSGPATAEEMRDLDEARKFVAEVIGHKTDKIERSHQEKSISPSQYEVTAASLGQAAVYSKRAFEHIQAGDIEDAVATVREMENGNCQFLVCELAIARGYHQFYPVLTDRVIAQAQNHDLRARDRLHDIDQLVKAHGAPDEVKDTISQLGKAIGPKA